MNKLTDNKSIPLMEPLDLNFNRVKELQEKVMNQALSEGLRRNEERYKECIEYRKKYEKTKEALEKLPLELTVNCMVPIGKHAMIRGKLIHTNEVLACLGEDYFVKYSAAQATALCNRRIQSVEEVLKNLETERNLYEARQYFLPELGILDEPGKKNLVEHWDEEKLNDWRVEHRQKEKEYHKKLSELKKKESTDIKSEEDLFRRLDELELQEELEDEMNRLQDEHKQLYLEEAQEEDYYETDESSTSEDEQKIMEEIKIELDRLKVLRASRSEENPETKPEATDKIHTANELPNINAEATPGKVEKVLAKADSEVFRGVPTAIADNDSTTIVKSKSVDNITKEETKVKKQRRVSLVIPNSLADDDESGKVSEKNQGDHCTKATNNDTEGYGNDDNIVRIEFVHSNSDPCIPEFTGNRIESPRDIYTLFYKPKSILKRSPNDTMYNSVLQTNNLEEECVDTPEAVKCSAYNFVVKDICEKESAVPIEKNEEIAQNKKPVSKFKKERKKKSMKRR